MGVTDSFTVICNNCGAETTYSGARRGKKHFHTSNEDIDIEFWRVGMTDVSVTIKCTRCSAEAESEGE